MANEWADRWLYVMMIEKGKTYNRMTAEVVGRHVANLRQLDDEGRIALCGAFKGYPGVAGMVVLRADSHEEADEICRREPLIVEGYATYRLSALQVAQRGNDYLL